MTLASGPGSVLYSRPYSPGMRHVQDSPSPSLRRSEFMNGLLVAINARPRDTAPAPLARRPTGCNLSRRGVRGRGRRPFIRAIALRALAGVGAAIIGTS